MLRKQKLIIFIGECKNQEMLLCIKYLNRKGIEVRDGSSHKLYASLLLTFNLLKSRALSFFFFFFFFFFGRRADLRAILTSIFLSWRHKNFHILKACTGIMWLG